MVCAINLSQKEQFFIYEQLTDPGYLKDFDNLYWLFSLSPDVQAEWFNQLRWIRLTDLWAEQELLKGESSKFSQFCNSWNQLKKGQNTLLFDEHKDILTDIRKYWLLQQNNQNVIKAWDGYLNALSIYHYPHFEIKTLHEHKMMTKALSGNLFQVLPYLEDSQFEVVEKLGQLDQIFNNLRDLKEDSENGLCYFPTDVLTEFGLTKTEILSSACFSNPGYYQLMEFWLDEYVHPVFRETLEYLETKNLHYSWQRMTDWFLLRYRRVETLLRKSHFNFHLFHEEYWMSVKELLK